MVERDIEAVTAPCREAGVLSKVIIEAALLTDDEKVTACTLAKAAGADFVKTSTGFGPGGATAADVALMRRVVGEEMGVKAAGGVRDLDGLKAMVAAGATRIGASAGVRIVQESRGADADRGGEGLLVMPGGAGSGAGRRAISAAASAGAVLLRAGRRRPQPAGVARSLIRDRRVRTSSTCAAPRSACPATPAFYPTAGRRARRSRRAALASTSARTCIR